MRQEQERDEPRPPDGLTPVATIWSGAISFGLVHIPVRLVSATTEHDVPLHQVHDEDGGRISYERVCRTCGEAIPYEHLARAYEEDDERVVLTDEDLESLAAARSHEISVIEFVPTAQIDSIRLERSYFLEPQDRAHKPYVLLRDALLDSDRTAVATVSLRQRTRLATLRVYDDVILLQTLRWDDEVRVPAVTPDDIRLSTAERKAAATLVDSLARDFEPAQFRDDYTDQLRDLVARRIEGGEAVAVSHDDGADGTGQVLDLMEALRRSVAEAGDAPEAAPAKAVRKAPARKAPASKTPASKTARKTPARKRPARSA